MVENKKQQALLGALLGDACGVPYEFKDPTELPDRKLIDMTPPKMDMLGRRFSRTYGLLDGTWSDDGSLLLCLLEALQESTDKEVWPQAFAGKAINWRINGYYAVGGVVFDIGNQTAIALSDIEEGTPALQRGEDPDYSSGNGSLMRGLAPALVATSLEQAVELGCLQSMVTHNTEDCRVACMVYAALAYKLLQGASFEQALADSLVYATPSFLNAQHDEPCGRGYVVNSFWSAIWAVQQGKSFKNVIQAAISLGNDTDTTACIAGGLAGIMYELPQDWLDKLRGKDLLENVLAGL